MNEVKEFLLDYYDNIRSIMKPVMIYTTLVAIWVAILYVGLRSIFTYMDPTPFGIFVLFGFIISYATLATVFVQTLKNRYW